jgi:hypothetical protein
MSGLLDRGFLLRSRRWEECLTDEAEKTPRRRTASRENQTRRLGMRRRELQVFPGRS